MIVRRVVLIMVGGLLCACFLAAVAGLGEERTPERLGPPVILDSRGRTVGLFFFVNRLDVAGSAVLRKIGEFWYLLPISPTTGFLSTGTELFYTKPNCNGTAYVAASPDTFVLLPRVGSGPGIANGIVYYPVPGSIKPDLAFKSVKLISAGGKPMNCGNTKGFPVPKFAGKMATFDLSTLGFVPPFKLIQPGP